MEVIQNAPQTIGRFKNEELGDNVPIMKMVDQRRSSVNGVSLKDYVNSTTGKIEKPKFATAVMRFIGNHKKFSTAYFESFYHPTGKFWYGDGKEDKEKNMVGQIYRIAEPVKQLDLSKKNDLNLFNLLCVHSSVKGSINEDADACWIIDIPEIREQREVENVDLIEKALLILADLKKNEINDYAHMLNLREADGAEKQTRDALRKIAVTNPKLIVDVHNNGMKDDIVLFRAALKRKIIVEKNNVFCYENFQLGMTESNSVIFLQNNVEVKSSIKTDLEKKAK